MSDLHAALLRNLGNATGVSYVAGEPITAVSDLPEHRIEIHAFADANFAQAFTEGLALVTTNAVAWTWEPENRTGMRHVIVARLHEERPVAESVEDAVAVIHHARNNWESKHIADSLAKSHARDRVRAAQDREAMAPLRAALTGAGLKVYDGAMQWLRCGDGNTISRKAEDSYKVEHIIELHRAEGDEPLLDRYAAHFEALGLKFDPSNPYRLGSVTVASLEAVVDIVQRMDAAEAGMEGIAKAFWQERFMANLKMTKRFRTFIVGGWEGRVTRYFSRGNLSAEAGGITLKQTDINTLLRASWMLWDGQKFEITPEGLAAAQAK